MGFFLVELGLPMLGVNNPYVGAVLVSSGVACWLYTFLVTLVWQRRSQMLTWISDNYDLEPLKDRWVIVSLIILFGAVIMAPIGLVLDRRIWEFYFFITFVWITITMARAFLSLLKKK
jgi:hypothetical protein